jgi:response regulator NasT
LFASCAARDDVGVSRTPRLVLPAENLVTRAPQADAATRTLRVLAVASHAVTDLDGFETTVVPPDTDLSAALELLRPDVVLVRAGDGDADADALAMVHEVARRRLSPVVVLVDEADPEFAGEAAARGAHGVVSSRESELIASTLELAVLRFEEVRRLVAHQTRLGTIERAKGILMERHGLDERAAFERLRSLSRSNGVRILDVSTSIGSARRARTPAGAGVAAASSSSDDG